MQDLESLLPLWNWTKKKTKQNFTLIVFCPSFYFFVSVSVRRNALWTRPERPHETTFERLIELFIGADRGLAVVILTHQQLPPFPLKSASSPDVDVDVWADFITGVSWRENPRERSVSGGRLILRVIWSCNLQKSKSNSTLESAHFQHLSNHGCVDLNITNIAVCQPLFPQGL